MYCDDELEVLYVDKEAVEVYDSAWGKPDILVEEEVEDWFLVTPCE